MLDLSFPLYIKKNKVETEAGNFLRRVGKEREADLLEASDFQQFLPLLIFTTPAALDHQDLSSGEVDLVKCDALLISYMARSLSYGSPNLDTICRFSAEVLQFVLGNSSMKELLASSWENPFARVLSKITRR
ncbi:hypothetical protein POTOM_053956 [Populus tomentosa]|uniref:Uncharacterized protein n=1 Tax=Populus tomentosa TaxID=118781 RepID=A0A8X7Y682_POPTO|nr:hypothetical protein POTOM_053956 [Populus tomentosa]